MSYRSLVSFVLAAIAVFVVGCSGANVSQPTTYSSDQLAQLDIYAPRVAELRDRFPELEEYIQKKDWSDISSFIHGPMGELRIKLGQVASRLLPQDAAQAKELSNEIAAHLERLDAATESLNQIEAGKQYRLALDDFDSFMSLIPDKDA